MNNKPTEQFWFKPRRFRGHDAICICDGKHFIDLYRLHGKRYAVPALINKFLKIGNRTSSTEILQSCISPRIGYSQHCFKHVFLEHRDIKAHEGSQTGINRTRALEPLP